MATRACVVCSRPFEAKRSTAKYCGSGCRARASVARATSAEAVPASPAGRSDLVRVTRAALEAVGVVDTVDGQAALLLAERMSSPFEPGSAVASMSRQLQVVMAEALKSVKASDPLDELRLRRDSKRAG